MISAAEWYDPTPELEHYNQGDILKDIPFFIFPTHSEKSKENKWPVLRPRFLKAGRTFEEAMRQLPAELTAKAAKDIATPALWSHPMGEYVMAVARRTTVMIVTRSCAVDKPSTKHFLVAPVIAIEQLPAPARTPEKLEYLRNNDVFEWFYLPASEGLKESFADLAQLLPVHWTFFGEKPTSSDFVARLSAYGTSSLQSLLSDFYGKVFGFSAKDKCPQAGMYTCSKCFYVGRTTPTRKQVEHSQSFGECPQCGDDATWVKLPEAST